jgi:hypothetical protein
MHKLVLAALLLCGCGSAKQPITDDLSSIIVTASPSDPFSGKVKLAGTLSYGGSKTTYYTSSPRYRAYQFTGGAGDSVGAWVHSSTGDAVAWLTDSAFDILMVNDEADSTTLDSYVSATLPSSGTYYVIFRDYNLDSNYFTVELEGTPAVPASCGYGSNCPSGYSCVNHSCYAQCGGPSQVGCIDTSKHCIVDPNGSCDPASDANCWGICGTDCRATGCNAGHKCSTCWGSYVCIASGSTC